MTSLALALALILSTPAPPTTTPAAPQGVRLLLVRHAEAVQQPGDPPLTPEGRARAACLVDTLRDERITHLFTSPWTRTRTTLEPLAQSRKLSPVERDPSEAGALAAELASLPDGSVALVAGHSNTLPLLATALGGELSGLVPEAGQMTIPRMEHDRLVVVTIAPPADDAAGRRALRSLEERRYGCPPTGGGTGR